MPTRTSRTQQLLLLSVVIPLLFASACSSSVSTGTSTTSTSIPGTTATSVHAPLASFKCPSSTATSNLLGAPVGEPSSRGGTVSTSYGPYTDWTCNYSVGVRLEVGTTRLPVAQFEAEESQAGPQSNGNPITQVSNLGQAAYVWTSSVASANDGLPVLSHVIVIDKGTQVQVLAPTGPSQVEELARSVLAKVA